MENGVTRVEEVKLKLEEFGKDVFGDGMKGIGIDDAVEEVNGGVDLSVEEAEESLIKDGNDENGEDLSASVDIDGSVDARQRIVDTFEDAIETPYETQKVMEKALVDPVEEVILTQVVENNELVDSDELEGKGLNLTEFTDEGNVSSSTFGDHPSELEANEAVNDGNSEAEVGVSTSDNAARDQASDLVTDVSVSDGEDEVKMVGVTDVSRDEPNVLENNGALDDGVNEITNSSDADHNDEPNVLENNGAVDSGVNEVTKASDCDHNDEPQVLDNNGAVDNGVYEVTKASDANHNDEPNVLESNGAVDNGVNEVTKASDVDHNDKPQVLENNGVVDNEVTKASDAVDNESQMAVLDIYSKKPVAVMLEDSENGVSDNVDLDENVISDNCVNGESTSHITQPDGEIGVQVNRYVPSQLHEEEMLVTEGKDDDSMSQKEKVESSRSNLLTMQNELSVEQIQEGMQKSFDPSSVHQDDKSLQQESTSAIKEPDNKVESPKVERHPSEKSESKDYDVRENMPLKKEPELRPEKSEPKDYDLKQNMPLKKEPELRPVIGIPLSTEKPATPTTIPNLKPEPKPTTIPNPKPDTKLNQPPVPNSKPTTPTPASAPTPTRPAGLGNGAPLLEPAHRVVQSQPNGYTPPQNQVIDEPAGESEENDDTREKLQMIRVKFLRLARRLGQTPHNVVVAQVLYRLGLAEQLRGSNGGRVAAFSFERASAMAEQLESAGQEPLEFSCTIMVLGKTGVGKSATINSIFDEVKFNTDAFQLGTKKVQDVVGTVQGIKVRVIDTPGLLPSWNDQRKNEKILLSVKKFIQKSPPDIVLYLDRLDMQSRDFGDMPLLRTITDIFGQSIWFNAIVVLTHAASAPPEGPNGTTTSYDMFVTQRSHVVQQAIRQAAGDTRLMNPVSLVENHSACRTNRAGQRVLPNGQVWKPHLLLLSFASKILVEANMLLKLQDSPPGKPFGQRTRAPPLPFILSNLLQSRPQLQLPNEQFGDDDDMDELSEDESSEYDELPPFKRLTSAQLAKLSKVQKKAYYDELEYREKLFMKKQLKEEKKRRKMMKKMAEDSKNVPSEINNNEEEDSNGAATVPVAVQDMNLPVSFDAENPTHRYRALDSANQWLIRPVLDPHGWDHDVGYEGINIEHLLALREKIPVSFSGQVTKDKKDANLQMEISAGIKHGKSTSKSKATTLAFDLQTVGKDMSYTLRSETRFMNYKKNKASAGFSVTHFGDSVTGGVKFEDKLIINKRGQLVVAGGAVIGRGDVAYGGSLEATLRDKDYPLGRFLSTIGLSVMDWHGDLAIGWNGQTQIPIGRFTNLIGRVNLNNKGSGQVSVRLNSSEQLQIALAALVPVICKLVGYYQPRDTSY